jgi:hypothetical protein
MAYYPKSQLKPDLYTSGGEYILSTTKEEYKGYYYEVSTGKRYTGKNPQQGPNILLEKLKLYANDVPIPPSLNSEPIVIYDDDLLTVEGLPETFYVPQVQPSEYPQFQQGLPLRGIPTFNLTTPTSQDQQNGQFTRYFCKRNNEFKYLEISKATFNQLYTKSPEIAWDLYTPVSILWQIKGDKNKVYVSNKALTESIETKFKWYGFSQYFQGKFLKYYVES